jgi:RecA/RadA recombinase
MAQRKTKKVVDEIKESVTKKNTNKKDLLSSGCTVFDLVTGKLPFGIINIVGDTTTGKTYLTLEILAHLRKKFGKKLKWFWDKAEGRFSWNTENMYGYDVLPDEMEKRKSITVEDMAFNLKKELDSLKQDEFLIYIIDSLDGLSSDEELKREDKMQAAKKAEKKLETGTFAMGKAKDLSKFFRLRTKEIADKKCILLVISQVRDNIGITFGRQYRRNGGKGLDHYSDVIAWLAVAEKHKKKGREYASTIKIKTDKTSNGQPRREGFIELVYDYGVDNVLTNINFLYDLKTETGKNIANINKKLLDWESMEFTRKKLIQYIEENDLENDLENKVVEKWNEIEQSISSKGRKAKWQ